jgi:predicted dehydrogenase
MMDSGTHLVYQSLYLLGVPEFLGSFSARKHYLEMDGEDVCQISFQYADGAVGQIYQSWSSSDGSAGEIRIEGDKGNLLISDRLYKDGKAIENDSSYQDSFFHTLKAFIAAVEGGPAPLSGLEEAETTLNLILTAYRAAENKQVIRVGGR